MPSDIEHGKLSPHSKRFFPSSRPLTGSKRGLVRLWLPALVVLCLFAGFLYMRPDEIAALPSKIIVVSDPVIAAENTTTAVVAVKLTDTEKRDAIVSAFKHAWHAYETDAMGSDEFHPLKHVGQNISEASGGIGYTVVDALDTMHIMGLTDELERARTWVQDKLSFDRDGTFSTFEVTIRVLGGLLSMYSFTVDKLYLDKAVDLADRMMGAFETPSGLPTPSVNLARSVGVPDQYAPDSLSTAEAATLQLEFRYLANLTGNTEYWYKVENVMQVLNKVQMSHHLVPIHMSLRDGTFTPSDIRLGSRGDSYYEYLLKQYLQTASTEGIYRQMYNDAMTGLHQELVQKTVPLRKTYIAELVYQGGAWKLSPKQDHLVCFLAGSLMLGATTVGAVKPVSVPPQPEELSQTGLRDWKTGVALLETCMNTYETATGLSPEIVEFKTKDDGSGKDWFIRGARPGGSSPYDARYMLRPETVESLFIAWRLTRFERYRNYAWSIFSSIEKYARIPAGGYATVLDVDKVPVNLGDKQETFFLSETLKYLYLTFSDADVIPLDKYVFNTEAHPLPIFNSTIQPKFTL
ncbi:glycoside hydrolase [Mycena floridula]|nr:glycoside hydrolase [Mycena floridula]